MRILFVTPSGISSGEAITALHMAEALAAKGHRFHVLASEFTAGYFQATDPAFVSVLTNDLEENRALWKQSLAALEPQAVVFADYSLLFFEGGAPPLADDVWIAELESTPAVLMTLDHLGYAQRSVRLHFGPPHLSFHCETVRPAPECMRILLPCPIHEPRPIAGRRGEPFRYWTRPELGGGELSAIRGELTPDPAGVLVLHSAPGWAARFAAEWRLPYYAYLPAILDAHLAEVPGPVTVVSLNHGPALTPPAGSRVRFRDLAPRSKQEFERILLAADLVLTENGVSATLGKAVCGFVPAAVLANGYRLSELPSMRDPGLTEIVESMEHDRSGAVFPYDVFPIWGSEELELLKLYERNTITRGFERLEVFADETKQRMVNLLADGTPRAAMRSAQEEYASAVDLLPGPAEILEELLGVRS